MWGVSEAWRTYSWWRQSSLRTWGVRQIREERVQTFAHTRKIPCEGFLHRGLIFFWLRGKDLNL